MKACQQRTSSSSVLKRRFLLPFFDFVLAGSSVCAAVHAEHTTDLKDPDLTKIQAVAATKSPKRQSIQYCSIQSDGKQKHKDDGRGHHQRLK
jgi:hypothetical protein